MLNRGTILASAALIAVSSFNDGGGSNGGRTVLTGGEIAGHRVLRNYTPHNSGLVNPSVNVVFQDNKGRIWMGTERGLSVFDESLKQWTSFTSHTGELLENRVSMIGQSSDQKLWFAGYPRGILGPGVSCFDGEHWSQTDVTRKSLTISERYPSADSVQAMFKGRSGRLWFAIEDGLVSYDGKEWKRYLRLSELTHRPRPIRIYAGIEDKDGAVWIGAGGILKLDPRNFTCRIYDPMKPLVESSKTNHEFLRRIRAERITYIYEDRQSRLWFASADGHLYVYCRESESWETYSLMDAFRGFGDQASSSTSDGESENPVPAETGASCIYQDNRGQMLIATNRGLAVLREDSKSWRVFTSQNSDLTGTFVRTIVEDSRGRIWIGTDLGITVLDN